MTKQGFQGKSFVPDKSVLDGVLIYGKLKEVGPSNRFWCLMKMCALTGRAENGSLL
jgi:hypothetical protein